LNLHRALLEHSIEVDFFVMTSSVSGYVGYTSQSNYAAANTFLDYFARYRRSLGLTATSVSLGKIEQVGVFAHETEVLRAAAQRFGISSLDEQEFLYILGEAIRLGRDISASAEFSDDPQSSSYILSGLEASRLLDVADSVVPRISTDLRSKYLYQEFERLQAQELRTEDSRMPERADKLQGLISAAKGGGDAALEPLLQAMRMELSNLTLQALEEIEVDKPLVDYALDSMVNTELRTWTFLSFNVMISFLEMLEPTLTLRKLGESVFARMSPRTANSMVQ